MSNDPTRMNNDPTGMSDDPTRKHNDPTRMRNQPALTTSTGKEWLIVGALFAAISIGVLIPMTLLPPAGVALAGAIAVGALYLVMVATRLLAQKWRLRLMAAEMLLMAVAALGAVYVVAATGATP